MERVSKTLIVDEIIEMNRQMLEAFGGHPFIEPDNFANGGSLLWVLGAISAPVFGVDRYPTITQKAAALGWNIIVKHVFNDANKRTGMLACLVFLEINGYNLLVDFPLEDETLKFAEDVAKNLIDLPNFANWVEQRIISYDYSC